MTIVHRPRLIAALLAGTLLAAASLLAVAPEERTLGAGIKWVYVHVALVWTGMSVTAVFGVIGALVVATGSARWLRANFAVGCIGAGFIAASTLVSMGSSAANWGGVHLTEPRMLAMLRYSAASVIALVPLTWPMPARAKGAIAVALAALLFITLRITPLQLHPRDPIGQSGFAPLQAAFAGLYALGLLTAAWLLWAWAVIGRASAPAAPAPVGAATHPG